MSIKGFVRGVDQRLTELERRPLATGDAGSWGQISATMAGFVMDAMTDDPYWGRGTENGELAWLFGTPTLVNDKDWDISGVELSGSGYARQPIKFIPANFDPPTGHSPVVAPYNKKIVFGAAAADWVPITHFAVMSEWNDEAALVTELTPALMCAAGQHIEINAGDFVLKVHSI